MGQLLIGNPVLGGMRTATLEEIMALMSPEGHKKSLTAAKRVVGLILDADSTPADLKAMLQDKKYISDLPKSQRQAALDTTGTAMCPVFDCPYIIVGSMGSIWYDCVYRGKKTRIAINPTAAGPEDAYCLIEL